MKIFDYHGLKKGKLLANIKLPQAGGQRIGMVGKVMVRENMSNGIGNEEIFITADDFDTDYIIYCTGKEEGTNKWNWEIIPSKELAKKAIKRNIRKFGTRYYQENKRGQLNEF